MALTQKDIDRILGNQSPLQRAAQRNQPTITNTPRDIVSGTYADILKPFVANPVAEFIGAADMQKALESASYGSPLTTGGSVQTGGFRPEYLAAALGLTPIGKGKNVAKIADLDLNPAGKAIANSFYMWNPKAVNKVVNKEPISVVKLPDGRFHVIDGYHRVLQAQKTGKDTININEVEMTDLIRNSLLKEGTIKPSKTAFEDAFDLAQRNATLPVSKGGLGLPATNTAMDRAKAMGFNTPSFRSVDDPTITYFKPSEMGTYGGGVYSAKSPEVAEGYGNEFLMPLLINQGKNKTFDSFSDYVTQKTNKRLTNQYKDDLTKEGYDSLNVKFFKDGDVREYNNFNPSDVRSRFAAFDPFRRNESDILAGAVATPVGLLTVDENKKKKTTKK